MITGKVFSFICVLIVTQQLVCCKACARECTGAEEFWRRFRQAVIVGETGEVASMTKFPFRVGGILDSDQVVSYDRVTFPPILSKLLMQKILFVREDYQIVETTMLRHIQDKKNLAPQDYKSPSLIVVELFTFECRSGRWLFTEAFIEE